MSNALNQWSLVKRINWPQLPKEMSVSQLLEIEDCPLRWLLEHADYPEIWNRHGYPRKISLPALNGLIIHSCIEIIIGELINAGCHTLADSNAVNVMKHLGGYSNIIQSTIEQSLKYYEGNPRTEGSINSILSSLRTNIPDLRSKVQLLLGRIFVNRQGVHFVRSNIIQPDKIRSALPFGIHFEVELCVPLLKWRGRADLITLTDTLCEIVDFKTGAYNDKHEFQMRVYALLWYKDSLINPTGKLVNKMKLSYLQEDIEVPAPKLEMLNAIESDIKERTIKCRDLFQVSPPKSRLDIAKCPFCEVRHLCDKYWQDTRNLKTDQSWMKQNRFIDVEARLTDRHSTLSWNAIVNGAPYLTSGTPISIRFPANHY